MALERHPVLHTYMHMSAHTIFRFEEEDDKEDEKKGFSMWESISRSVTPPAPSGTESPIHVKIEE